MTGDLTVREARAEDAARLLEIYSHYVLNTAVSFEYAVPSVSGFAERIRQTLGKYPYLVCEKQGEIIGYAYAGAYGKREAFAWTAETSIYVDPAFRRHGAGAVLYRALEKELQSRGIVNLLAGVAWCAEEDEYLSHDSYHFHVRMGYVREACLKAVGKKFGRWYDLLWMQKKLRAVPEAAGRTEKPE